MPSPDDGSTAILRMAPDAAVASSAAGSRGDRRRRGFDSGAASTGGAGIACATISSISAVTPGFRSTNAMASSNPPCAGATRTTRPVTGRGPPGSSRIATRLGADRAALRADQVHPARAEVEPAAVDSAAGVRRGQADSFVVWDARRRAPGLHRRAPRSIVGDRPNQGKPSSAPGFTFGGCCATPAPRSRDVRCAAPQRLCGTPGQGGSGGRPRISRTGTNERRCTGQAPNRPSARTCSATGYPLCCAKP